MTPAFDTLKFVKHLREAGISESQAEALAYMPSGKRKARRTWQPSVI